MSTLYEILDIDLADVKAYLRVDHDDDDSLLDLLVKSACDYAEEFLNWDDLDDKTKDDIPAAVELACVRMVASWYEQRRDDVTSETVEGYSYSIDDIPWSARNLLIQYRRFPNLMPDEDDENDDEDILTG